MNEETTETDRVGNDGPGPESETWLLHLYRAFSADSTTWRGRLDVTANWAVPLVLALTTFALGERTLPHLLLLLLGWAVIAVTVLVEARRYRVVHHAVWRTREIERGYFAPLLESRSDDSTWRSALAADLRAPKRTIGLWAAIGARLRSVYLVLIYLLFLAWIAKVIVHPEVTGSGREILERISVGDSLPGGLVLTGALLVLAAVTLVAIRSPSLEELEERALD